MPVDLAERGFVEPLVAAGLSTASHDRRVGGRVNYLDADTAEYVIAQIADVPPPAAELVADYVEMSWFKGSALRAQHDADRRRTSARAVSR